MKPITVIADDLTGAAEMAGIGLRYGLETRLILQRDPSDSKPTSFPPLYVYNLNTRPMAKHDACATVAEFAGRLAPDFPFFKKVDSVLRGHVIAEVEAMMQSAPHLDRVLLVPQNPSRGRVILPDGTYLVSGVPLAQTTFSIDPDFPATTSNAIERLGPSTLPIVMAVASGFPNAPVNQGMITLGPASSVDEVAQWVQCRNTRTLLAGGADAFAAFLATLGRAVVSDRPAILPFGRKLFLCGSTAMQARRELRQYATVNRIDILTAEPDRVRQAMRNHVSAIVMSPEPGGVEADPREIEEAMGACAKAVIEDGPCDWIFVEGGATAAAVCRAMNWTSLQVDGELAPGVVVLKPDADVRLVIKPGSYAWPASVL